MPSPFPGMDPYLESPDWFPDLHGSLIIFMKETLQRILPGPYYAQSSQRVWLEYTKRFAEPDIEVVRSARKLRKQSRGGVAVAEVRPPGPLVVSIETIEHGPFKENFLEIRQRRGGGDPDRFFNRSPQSIQQEGWSPESRKVSQRKQEKTLDSQDLHLGSKSICSRGEGSHTLAVPKDLVVAQAGKFDWPGVDPSIRPAQGLSCLSDRAPRSAPPDRDPTLAGRPGCTARP